MALIDEYRKRKKRSEDYCYPHWERAIDNYKHYLGRLDVGGITEGEYPFQSQMVLPISYETVETVMPRIIGRDPEFTAIAVEPDDVPSEQTARLTIDSQYNNPKLELLGEPIYLKLNRGTKEQLITGNVVYRAFWRRQARKQMSYLANFENGGFTDEKDIKKVLEAAEKAKKSGEVWYSKKLIDSPFLDDFDIKHLPFFWFMPDPEFAETGRMRYKIERCFMTFEELAEEALMYKYDKATMDEIHAKMEEGKHGFTPDIPKDFLNEYNDLFDNVNRQSFVGDDDKIPLLIVDKMWMGDKVGVFVNEKWSLTGDEPMTNPYDVMVDPFIFGHNIVIPHSYFSWGEIDAIKRLEDGATDMMNMRFDNLMQSMLNFWLYNPNYMSGADEFVPIPNTATAVTDVDRAVKMIKANDVTANAYTEAQEMIGIIQRVTGVNDYVKGEEGQTLAGRTYGGLRLVQEMANARFIVKARMFEKLTLKALGYFILEMSRQFINKDRVSRVVGKSGEVEDRKIKAADLKMIKGMMDIKVVPNASMVIDQQAEAMRMNAIADRFVAQKGPFEQIPPEVYDKFLLRFLEAYNITDAPYWVRQIREEREKLVKEEKKAAAQAPQPPAGAGMPAMPPAPPQNTGVSPAMPAMDMMQSNGIAPQIDPLAQIANQELNMPPAAPIDLGGIV